VVAGKADYMSPEQADFQITDKRSDLFSVGVVLAHLLLGRNIFKGDPEASRQRILTLADSGFPVRSTDGLTAGSTRFCTAHVGARPLEALPDRG
jgi:serine/threonine protein kinase